MATARGGTVPYAGVPSSTPTTASRASSFSSSKHSPHASSSSSSSEVGTTANHNNNNTRFAQTYAQVQQQCPEAIFAYAACVSRQSQHNHRNDHKDNDAGASSPSSPSYSSSKGLVRNDCSDEFQAVKDCWKTVRGFGNSGGRGGGVGKQ